jgi:hypothetical protein
MSRFKIFIISFCIASIGFSQKFSFEKLVFQSEKIELKSRELPQLENLVVLVAGIKGFNIVEGQADLGLEVLVTDENEKEMMYSADMLEGIKVPIQDINNVEFNFNLTEEFIPGKSYFLKVRMWDKIENKEYTKETSIRVLEPIFNPNVKISDNGFHHMTNKIFLNKLRYFEGNLVHEGDELYVDLFFGDINIDKKTSVNYEVEIVDLKKGKSYSVENDVIVASKPEDLSNLNYSMIIQGEVLEYGEKYAFKMKFTIPSKQLSFEFEYQFLFQKAKWKSKSVSSKDAVFSSFVNREKVKENVVVYPGDRFDFEVLKLNNMLVQENGASRVGGAFVLYDAKGNKLSESDDFFAGFDQISSDQASEISLHYNVSSDFDQNSKYVIESILWDKFSNKYYSKKFAFKTAKLKDLPFGDELNPQITYHYDAKKVSPKSVYVLVNGYRSKDGIVSVGDEVVLKASCKKFEDVNTAGFKSLIQILDSEGKVINETFERAQNFEEGEIFATITIPSEGYELNKEVTLVAKLMDFNEVVMSAEYTFKVAIR